MKVDSNGNPVSEGTFGLYHGNYAARVERTFINPVTDNEDIQEALTEYGAFFVTRGSAGPGTEELTYPDGFAIVDRPDVVFAQDGAIVRVGDVIMLETWPKSLTPYRDTGVTVHALYPVGALQGTVCCTVDEAKHDSSPDGYFPIMRGNIVSIKRAATSTEHRDRVVLGTTDTRALTQGDYIEFKDDGNGAASGFVGEMKENGQHNGWVWIVESARNTSKGSKYWFETKKITRVYPLATGPWTTPAGFVQKGDQVTLKDNKGRTIVCTIASARFDQAYKDTGLVLETNMDITASVDGTIVDKPPATAYWAKSVTAVHSRTEDNTNTMPAIAVGDAIQFVDDAGSLAEGVVGALFKSHGYNGTVVLTTAATYTDKGEAYAYKDTNVRIIVRNGDVLYVHNNNTDTNATTIEGTTDTMSNEATGAKATELKLNTLAQAQHNKAAGKVDVVHEGTQILLPEKGPAATLRGAIAELQRRAEQEEMDVNIMELIEGYPLDAAHAFIKALEGIFGWVNAMPTPGFFGPTPPTMIGIDIDADGHTVQIPWGQIGIPGITGKLATGIQVKDGSPIFCIQGTIKQKDKRVVNEIATAARNYLKEHSLYRGKAVRVRFPEAGKAWSPLDHQPKFINTANVRPEELIFSKDVEKRIRVNVWTPIVSNAAVRAARVPLKRGVLVYGRYGVGKTLLATVTAQMAVKSGITFIDLEDSKQLPEAIRFARGFGGMVVIFAEDIDRCDENGTRTDAFNNILNTVDGLTSKTDEVLVVYTTNHIERISKAMLRQGRIDKVIEVCEPDAEAACRLIRLYARHMLDKDENIDAVGAMIAEQKMIPAAIREIVEQSKLAAIERGDVHKITSADLTITVEDTRTHNELLKETPVDDRSEFEKLGDAMGARIGAVVERVMEENGVDYLSNEDGDTIDDGKATVTAGVTDTVRDATSRRRLASRKTVTA